MNIPKYILPIIVFSQFCCTCIWFASNAVMGDLMIEFNLSFSAVGYLTSCVQFGFISGTLTFAFFTISDRYSPSKVFFVSAILASIFNVLMVFPFNNFLSLSGLRFLSGFFLAGIYPVGMKIASDYFPKTLGLSLGFLVGALVLGTAFPHLLNFLSLDFEWCTVIFTTSILAIIGGVNMLLFIPNGPYHRASSKMDLAALPKIFIDKKFRYAALGYFGHMWELYAFWAFVPAILIAHSEANPIQSINVALISFVIIGVGSLSCILSGYVAQKIGSSKSAFIFLSLSMLCCLGSAFILENGATAYVLIFLIFWGAVIIADSPQFSTLVAQNSKAQTKGTALTIVNCIGFAISIVSIQALTFLFERYNSNTIYLLLAIGPFFGLLATRKLLKSKPEISK